MRRTWLWGAMAVALAIYVAKLARVLLGLRRLRPGTNGEETIVSVIVPARNEGTNVGACLDGLDRQSYPRYLMEIIVVDDRSSDGTAEIVRAMRARNPRIRLVTVDEVPPGIAPKKHAIATGIASALGDIVVTTDADCTHPPGWIAGLVRMFEPDVGVVVGHTVYREPRTWFEGLQAIDYLSHRIIGAGTIGAGGVLTGTASNLAYRKRVFEEIGGFGDGGAVVSGDDDLFLHRVRARTSWRIAVASSPETFVTTEPVAGWRAFLGQRARWASKTTRYNRETLPFLMATFVLFLLIVLLLPFAIARPRRWMAFWAMLAVKWGVDYAVMRTGTRTFGQQGLMRYFWIANLLNPFYVVAATVWGVLGAFSWKGARFSRTVGHQGECGDTPHDAEEGSR